MLVPERLAKNGYLVHGFEDVSPSRYNNEAAGTWVTRSYLSIFLGRDPIRQLPLRLDMFSTTRALPPPSSQRQMHNIEQQNPLGRAPL